jgi:hypothetical protein
MSCYPQLTSNVALQAVDSPEPNPSRFDSSAPLVFSELVTVRVGVGLLRDGHALGAVCAVCSYWNDPGGWFGLFAGQFCLFAGPV